MGKDEAEMTAAEAEICKGVFARQIGSQATPQSAYRMMMQMCAALEAHGSSDAEGKTLGYLLWVIMTAAAGRGRMNAAAGGRRSSS